MPATQLRIHSQLVFEVMIFITTVLNANFRPRDHRTAITTALYRDGFVYFVVSSESSLPFLDRADELFLQVLTSKMRIFLGG